jgi:hypothetical protein
MLQDVVHSGQRESVLINDVVGETSYAAVLCFVKEETNI